MPTSSLVCGAIFFNPRRHNRPFSRGAGAGRRAVGPWAGSLLDDDFLDWAASAGALGQSAPNNVRAAMGSFDIDVKEDKDSYTIIADTPGMTKDNVRVEVHDNILTLTGEREESSSHKTMDTTRTEVMGADDVCVCVLVRVCARACVGVCACACVCVRACVVRT